MSSRAIQEVKRAKPRSDEAANFKVFVTNGQPESPRASWRPHLRSDIIHI